MLSRKLGENLSKRLGEMRFRQQFLRHPDIRCRKSRCCPSADPVEAISSQQKPRAVLIHVGRDNRIHGQPEGRAVEGGDSQKAPGAQRLQQRPEKRGVAQEYVAMIVFKASA